MSNWLANTRQFIADTITELRKCSWPGREELFESTVLVVISLLILALFVALADLISGKIINFLTM